MSSTETNTQSLAQQRRKWLIQSHRFRNLGQKSEKQLDYLDLISFSVENENYGIELVSLKEILKAKGIIRIPKGNPDLRGIINLRGMILTVIDLKKRLGMGTSEITRHSRIMLVRDGERSIGLLVDRVNEIIRMEKKSLSAPPSALTEEQQHFVQNVGKVHDQVIILPDLKRICAIE
ncbi:chemotaxis protein CheW [Deltaproteobacteria bacterium TL4]